MILSFGFAEKQGVNAVVGNWFTSITLAESVMLKFKMLTTSLIKMTLFS